LNAKVGAIYRTLVTTKIRQFIGDQLQRLGPHRRRAVCHADLHLNNILVSADNRVYIVDWENRASTFFLVDALYSAAMIWQLLEGQPQRLKLLDERINSLAILANDEIRNFFWNILHIYQKAIATNPRFHDQVRPLKLAVAHSKFAIGTGFVSRP
jgi:thiamine kinase-like enzyme